MKRTISILALCVCVALASCEKDPRDSGNDGSTFTVTFDADGGYPVPAPQKVKKGEKAVEPEEQPVRGAESFIGWYSQTGLKFNFKSNPISKDITLKARYWSGPKKYVVINDYDWSYIEQSIHSYFGSPAGMDVAVGQGVLIYMFQRSIQNLSDCIKKHCQLAEQYDVPVLFQLDPVTFWDSVPELWNWWDKGQATYKESNRNNVEWYGWGNEYAVKIGWLDWGSQIRLKPMCNYFGPDYQPAVKERLQTFLGLIKEWYDSLPDARKYLLIGVKITGELGLGVNNWYYTGGNDLLDKNASNDPRTGLNMYNKPSRSNGDISTIGYAALTYSGIKTSGTVTGQDIADVEWKFTEFVSKIAKDYFPRELLFAHAGGVDNDLDACCNDFVCPSWSFYGADAANGENATHCMQLLKESDAPYWGVAEWAVDANTSANGWADAMYSSLKLDRCRFLSAYTNVIGNNNGSDVNNNAVNGIKILQNYSFNR